MFHPVLDKSKLDILGKGEKKDFNCFWGFFFLTNQILALANQPDVGQQGCVFRGFQGGRPGSVSFSVGSAERCQSKEWKCKIAVG